MYRLTAFVALIYASVATAQVPECPTSAHGRSGQRVERANEVLAGRFHDAINRQDWAAADRLVAPDYRHYVVRSDGFRPITWEAFKRGNQHLRSAFPDWNSRILQMIAEGDKVAVVLQGTGTHRGSVAGERATGRTATLPIMIVHQICGGRLVADWEVVNVGPLMEALNAP